MTRYITTYGSIRAFPPKVSFLKKKPTTLEVLFVGTGAEWLHHVLYLILHQNFT